jgi:hypothetical protein
VTRKDRGVHVEAYPLAVDRDENQKENESGVELSRVEKRLLSVATFLNSERRLWEQARYLDTEHAVRAMHPSKRESKWRPAAETEEAKPSTRRSG